MDVQAAVKAYRSGKTLQGVADELGVTRERVRAVLKRAGLTRRDGGAYIRALKRTEALEALMEEEGIGPKEAAKRLGIRPTSEALETARETRDARAITRFWARIDTSAGPDACHPWTGPKYPTGYGSVGHRIEQITGTQYAHRSAFILAHGRQPRAEVLFRGSACVLHSCDNPPCCNPRHLREGTMADNMRDRAARGRGFLKSGMKLALGLTPSGPGFVGTRHKMTAQEEENYLAAREGRKPVAVDERGNEIKSTHIGATCAHHRRKDSPMGHVISRR